MFTDPVSIHKKRPSMLHLCHSTVQTQTAAHIPFADELSRLGQLFAVDGLIYSTFAMALVALFFIRWLRLPNSKERLHVETAV